MDLGAVNISLSVKEFQLLLEAGLNTAFPYISHTQYKEDIDVLYNLLCRMRKNNQSIPTENVYFYPETTSGASNSDVLKYFPEIETVKSL